VTQATPHSVASAEPQVPIEGTNTRFLLMAAALLIVNSHLEAYYPVPYLAGDGLLGLSLFFFISGIGVTLSAQRGMRSFYQYYWRRIMRIYPTLWLITIPAALIRGELAHATPLALVERFIWPTANTFVGPLMVCYVLLYFVLRMQSAQLTLSLMLLLYLPQIPLIWTTAHSDKSLVFTTAGLWIAWITNFQIMLLASFLALRLQKIRRERFVLDVTGCAVLSLTFIVMKFVFVRKQAGWLFPLLYLNATVLFIFLFRIASSNELAAVLSRIRPVAFLIAFVGGCTLEIYFIQELLVPRPQLQHIRFPLNVLALWALLIPCAFLVQRIVAWMRTGFRKFDLTIDRRGM
jgi:peptidoglycan/LPS O-acetylase OafA/YrhL